MPVIGCGGQKECCRDGKHGEWSEWNGCSVTCGGGTQTRKRSLATKETWCGKPAEGPSVLYRPCNPETCGVINCQFSQWSAWLPQDACPGPCSEGHAARTRTVETHAHGGGLPCLGSTHEMERCPHSSSCTSYQPVGRDCVLSEWSEWTDCSQTCAKGYKEHTRSIKVDPVYGGRACPKVLRELAVCNADVPCSSTSPVACVWSGWSEWAVCDAKNEQVSSRGHEVAQANGGSPCAGAQKKVRPCGLCANSTYPCGWDQWLDWGPCTTTCGTGGARTRLKTLKAGEDAIMDERLYDSSLPKIALPLATPALESRARSEEIAGGRGSEMLSTVALGLTSLAVAMVARSICSRRRSAQEDAASCPGQAGSYEPLSRQEMLSGDAGLE